MNESHIKRVLVAMDATGPSKAALKSAAEIAARLRVELLGLFVEDINLLQLASLPFAREFVYGSSTGRKMDSTDMERSLRIQAERLRKNLEITAESAQVPYSFIVTRGKVASALLSVAAEHDLLVLGKVIKKTEHEYRLGAITQSIITHACCSVALLEHYGTPERPVIVLYDGSETSQRALELAVWLAKSDDNHLVIVLPAIGEKQREELKQKVEELTRSQHIEGRCVWLHHNDLENLLDVIDREYGRVFIFDATSDVWSDETRQRILASLPCPIVFFR